MTKGQGMDGTEDTSAQFAEFFAATGYVTIAQHTPDSEELKNQVPPGTPRLPPQMLAPGSLVFAPPKQPFPLDNPAAWWGWTTGADRQPPAGPGSKIDGRMDHPVVQVAWDDALAYAERSGKHLPTEAQWEFAARGGLVGKRFTREDGSRT